MAGPWHPLSTPLSLSSHGGASAPHLRKLPLLVQGTTDIGMGTSGHVLGWQGWSWRDSKARVNSKGVLGELSHPSSCPPTLWAGVMASVPLHLSLGAQRCSQAAPSHTNVVPRILGQAGQTLASQNVRLKSGNHLPATVNMATPTPCRDPHSRNQLSQEKCHTGIHATRTLDNIY